MLDVLWYDFEMLLVCVGMELFWFFGLSEGVNVVMFEVIDVVLMVFVVDWMSGLVVCFIWEIGLGVGSFDVGFFVLIEEGVCSDGMLDCSFVLMLCFFIYQDGVMVGYGGCCFFDF